METDTPVSVVRYNKTLSGRNVFNCGVESLDNYIAQHATQNEKRNVARVFVALDSNSNNIVGY